MTLVNTMINELASKRTKQRRYRLYRFMETWSNRFIDITNKRVCHCLPLSKLIEIQNGH